MLRALEMGSTVCPHAHKRDPSPAEADLRRTQRVLSSFLFVPGVTTRKCQNCLPAREAGRASPAVSNLIWNKISKDHKLERAA